MSNIKIEKDYDYLHIDGIDEETFLDNSTYDYNGFRVPRVTHIIKTCTDQEALIRWAASIPYNLYKNIQDKALTVGTIVHEMIDNYINFRVGKSTEQDKYPFDYNECSDSYRDTINIAYLNFKRWMADFSTKGYNITDIKGIEVPLVCPIYGGTADIIVTINDKWNYILDFKTSKEINYTYLLQLAAYEMIITSGYADPSFGPIHGIGVIRVDKTYDGIYNDIFISSDLPDMENYRRCFLSMVDTYYRQISSGIIYKNNNISYRIENNEELL